MSARTVRIAALALALVLGVAAQAKTTKASPKPPRATVVAATPAANLAVGKTTLWTEIVDNDSLRVRGLSKRPRLDWNAGMLFVFPEASPRTFWMIDCAFDLDIAYLDPQGVVRDIQTMVIEPGVPPERLRRYPSRTDDIMYALETNRGWMTSSGLRVGDTVPAIARYKTRR